MQRTTSTGSAGKYAPVDVMTMEDDEEEAAVPLAQAEQLVEVCAPADLPADYELTVQHGKDTSVVLVVRCYFLYPCCERQVSCSNGSIIFA